VSPFWTVPVTVSAAAWSGSMPQPTTAKTNKPNIVLLIFDTCMSSFPSHEKTVCDLQQEDRPFIRSNRSCGVSPTDPKTREPAVSYRNFL
jgi:hypothetical protein